MATIPDQQFTAELVRCPVCREQISATFTAKITLTPNPEATSEGERPDPSAVRFAVDHKVSRMQVSHDCLARGIRSMFEGGDES